MYLCNLKNNICFLHLVPVFFCFFSKGGSRTLVWDLRFAVMLVYLIPLCFINVEVTLTRAFNIVTVKDMESIYTLNLISLIFARLRLFHHI